MPTLTTGTGVTWVGVAVSWAETGGLLAIVATIVGIIAGLFTIAVAVYTMRLRSFEITRIRAQICHLCENGEPPAQCPYPEPRRKQICHKLKK